MMLPYPAAQPNTMTQTGPNSAQSPRRPFPAPAQRVLVIGLDGATFDVLNPLMEQGRMPRLRQAVRGGAAGPLDSTVPAITPAAWTTFLTGQLPGAHRVLDFESYDAASGRLTMNTTQRVRHVRNIWQILSDQGFKVGSVNVPMTYPPVPVNGFMVSGFDTPGPQSDFVYPPDLKDDILQRWPDPTLKSRWRRQVGGGDALFARNLEYIAGSFHQGAKMTTWLGERFGWDVLMVVFKLVDNLQHKTWKYLDPRWADRRPLRRERVRNCFAELDRAVGQLLDYADAHHATVMMVSDHGHGSLEGKIYANRLLQRWGYLALRGPLHRVLRRMGGSAARYQAARGIEDHLPVDLSRTRACVMHAGIAAFLYINLQGRQPGGIVEPADYEALRDELAERFLGPQARVRAPGGGTIPLFREVHKAEALYHCSRAQEPWLPDLILIPHDALAVVRRLSGRPAVRWLPYRKLEGTHRKEGIFIASGPGIARGATVRGRLADCAPTLLALLGLRIPEDMVGRVLTEAFAEPPVIERSPAPTAAAVTSGSTEGFHSAEELRQVTERLADLGYLE